MAENTVEIAVRLALEQFRAAVNQLEQTFGGAMSQVEAEAAVAGGALDEAFRALGVKSVRQVEQEVQKLQAALAVVRNLPGVLPADAERATAAFNARLAELRAGLNGVPAAARSTAGAVNDTAAALGNAAHKALAWGAAIAGVNGIGDLAKKVIDTGSAFEQLEQRLASLLGSQEEAANAFAAIRQLAAETPFEVNALTEAYAKLTAFGLEPSMAQMRAFGDTAATLGGGTQMLERVTLALGQAWTKGKLQGQEIMQMAEAGVPVWDLLAAATGKTTVELQKMSEAGRLGRDVIKALIDEMGRQNAGASAQLMDTYAGAVSNAKDATAEFFSMIARSGVLDYLAAQIRAVLAEYERMKDTGELQAKAKAIADAFLNFAEGVKTAFQALQALSGGIRIALEALAVQKVLSFAAALRAMATASTAAGAAAAAMGTQAAAAGAAAATAAGSVGLLSRAVGVLKGLTLVGLVEGVVSLGARFVEAKRAAEDGERAVAKMMQAKPAPVIDQVRDVVAETHRAKGALTEWQGELKKLTAEGKTAGEALKAMIDKASVVDMAGVRGLLKGLEDVRLSAQATGDDIEKNLAARLAGMTAGELRDFGTMAKMAFEDGTISARTLGDTMNELVDTSLAKLGIAAETSLGGMSRKFVEVRDHVALVAESFDQIAESGMDAGATLQQALDVALKAAATKQDLDALAASVRTLGEEGKLSQAKMTELLDAIKVKSEDSTAKIDSVGEALRRLGVKSQAELQKVADSFKEAWLQVERGGATLREQQEAFRAYAQAAIAANGGVADSYLEAKAAALGLTIEVDKAGKATVNLKAAAGDAEDGLTKAADAAKQIADNIDEAAAGADRLKKAGDDFAEGFTLSRQMLEDIANGVAKHSFISPDMARSMLEQSRQKAVDEEVARRNDQAWNDQIKAEADGRVGAASTARSAAAGSTTINLTLPGMTSPVPVMASNADAARLVNQLRDAGAVTHR